MEMSIINQVKKTLIGERPPLMTLDRGYSSSHLTPPWRRHSDTQLHRKTNKIIVTISLSVSIRAVASLGLVSPGGNRRAPTHIFDLFKVTNFEIFSLLQSKIEFTKTCNLSHTISQLPF